MPKATVLTLALTAVLVASADAQRTPPRYVRAQWVHWIDADRDCQTTRNEVLIRDADGRLRFGGRGCWVAVGRWVDPYTGRVFTDPRQLDVDHVVPLGEAHRTGGWRWSRAEKRAYANALDDPEHLLAVSARANRQKGDKSPADWLPARGRCEYVRAWLRIKAVWGLASTPRERRAIERVLASCP